MKQRSLKNQHRMLEVLLERFDAVDVTGMSAWEKARAVHERTAAGLVEGNYREAGKDAERAASMGPRSGRVNNSHDSRQTTPSVPSASPVATPLFTEEEAA